MATRAASLPPVSVDVLLLENKMKTKHIIFTLITLFVAALFILPGLGKASNCGGNSAAKSVCSSYVMSLALDRIEKFEKTQKLEPFDLENLSIETKKDI